MVSALVCNARAGFVLMPCPAGRPDTLVRTLHFFRAKMFWGKYPMPLVLVAGCERRHQRLQRGQATRMELSKVTASMIGFAIRYYNPMVIVWYFD